MLLRKRAFIPKDLKTFQLATLKVSISFYIFIFIPSPDIRVLPFFVHVWEWQKMNAYSLSFNLDIILYCSFVFQFSDFYTAVIPIILLVTF